MKHEMRERGRKGERKVRREDGEKTATRKNDKENETSQEQYSASNVWENELLDYEILKHEMRERGREGGRKVRREGEKTVTIGRMTRIMSRA